MTQRTDRVADLLRAELAEIIRQELRDPRIGLATVSSLSVSRDLGHAEVLVSVLGGDDEAREQSVAVLERAKGHIRRLLAGRVRLRTVPELNFRLDRGAEHSQRISEILENLHRGD